MNFHALSIQQLIHGVSEGTYSAHVEFGNLSILNDLPQHWGAHHDGSGWLFPVHVSTCILLYTEKDQSQGQLEEIFFPLSLHFDKAFGASHLVELTPGTPGSTCWTVPYVIGSLLNNSFEQTCSALFCGKITLFISIPAGSIPQLIRLFGQFTC